MPGRRETICGKCSIKSLLLRLAWKAKCKQVIDTIWRFFMGPTWGRSGSRKTRFMDTLRHFSFRISTTFLRCGFFQCTLFRRAYKNPIQEKVWKRYDDIETQKIYTKKGFGSLAFIESKKSWQSDNISQIQLLFEVKSCKSEDISQIQLLFKVKKKVDNLMIFQRFNCFSKWKSWQSDNISGIQLLFEI